MRRSLGITEQGHRTRSTEQGDVLLIERQGLPEAASATASQAWKSESSSRASTRSWRPWPTPGSTASWRIRYMELHGYLDHGCRVLSHPDRQVRLRDPRARAETSICRASTGIRSSSSSSTAPRTRSSTAILLLAQCHALHQAMPFLFEAIDDETELLLPDNLLQDRLPDPRAGRRHPRRGLADRSRSSAGSTSSTSRRRRTRSSARW